MENRVTHLRAKMDPADRAKQFMPFDALKGFREALKEKEREAERQKSGAAEHEETEILEKRYHEIPEEYGEGYGAEDR